jgi:hypothetical protein
LIRALEAEPHLNNAFTFGSAAIVQNTSVFELMKFGAPSQKRPPEPTTKLNRGKTMKPFFPFLMTVLPAAFALAQTQALSQPPSGVLSPKTTEVMVIQTARQGVTRQQIMNVMPAEIRATVKLYLDGKIRQWYSKGDGRGVIVFLDVKTVDEAHAIIDTLPLSKENLMDHEYIPVGPLLPLAGLISGGPEQH